MKVVDLQDIALDDMAKTLKVIAHPVRLEILLHLDDSTKIDVTTLCDKLSCGCEASMMSHHLTKMKAHGILTSVKEGKQVYYQVARKEVLNLFHCMLKSNP
tara:strand:- start:6270 stop:6572 length:303 start_codon:yes stop_codon:yes gene_type:complete